MNNKILENSCVSLKIKEISEDELVFISGDVNMELYYDVKIKFDGKFDGVYAKVTSITDSELVLNITHTTDEFEKFKKILFTECGYEK